MKSLQEEYLYEHCANTSTVKYPDGHTVFNSNLFPELQTHHFEDIFI